MSFVLTTRSASMTASSSAYGEPGTSQMPSYAVTSKSESVGSQVAATSYSPASLGTSAFSSWWLRCPRSSPNSPIVQVTAGPYRELARNRVSRAPTFRVLVPAEISVAIGRVQAEADTRNWASARVLEKLGFVHEGTLREDCVVNGEVSDSWVYGLIRREWRPTPESIPAR